MLARDKWAKEKENEDRLPERQKANEESVSS